VGGKYQYLPGAFDSPESWQAYWQVIGRIEKGELSAEPAVAPTIAPARASVAPNLLTVEELVERYMDRARSYYRRHDGTATGEADTIRYALQPLLDVCVAILVSEFKPSDLKAVRQEMIARGWCRRHINHSVRRIKTMFRWGVEEEIVPAEVAGAVSTVKALQEGRDPSVREKEEVEAVPDATIEKILPLVSDVAADVIRIMRYSGCRPGEVRQIKVETINRSDQDCWTCPLGQHKSVRKRKHRTLHFGPKCQAILARWLVKAGTGPIFPITHSGLRTAIGRACKVAGVPRFGPNALRHSAGTEARKRFGLEGAQHLLGHVHAKTSEIYAELDASKAREVARQIG
jgi:integrase